MDRKELENLATSEINDAYTRLEEVKINADLGWLNEDSADCEEALVELSMARDELKTAEKYLKKLHKQLLKKEAREEKEEVDA